jgi:hypothetical protein
VISAVRGTDCGPHGPECEILMIGSAIQVARQARGEAAGHSFPFLNSPYVSNFGQFRDGASVQHRATGEGLVYKPVAYLPKESFSNLMSHMEGER